VTWRPTALNISLLTLAGWALFLGVLTGRADLIVVAVPLVVALAAGRPRGEVPPVQIHQTLSTDRVVEDERVTVTVTVLGGVATATLNVVGPPVTVALVAPAVPLTTTSVLTNVLATLSLNVTVKLMGPVEAGSA